MKSLKQKLSVTISVSAGIFQILYNTPNAEEVVAIFLSNGNQPMEKQQLASIIGKDIDESISDLAKSKVLVKNTGGWAILPCLYDFLSFIYNVTE